MKPVLQDRAVTLRRRGATYGEILQKVPVAKSTLSLWLRSVGLAKRQRQRITRKRVEAQRRAADRKREIRLALTAQILQEAKREVGTLSKRELWLIGVALYWAEGSKQKEHHVSAPTQITNTDPRLLRIFLRWLNECCEISVEAVRYELYLHQDHAYRLPTITARWSRELNIPQSALDHIYYKQNRVKKTNRRNTGRDYIGCLRISVRNSANLNRRIDGWIRGIVAA